MDLIKIDNNKSYQKYEDILHMGDVLSLYDICRNKIIGYSTLVIYYRQAQDKELKALIKFGMDNIVFKHIDKIQKKLVDRGFNFPSKQNWKNKLDESLDFFISSSIIDDEEISHSLRELIRLTMTLETEAVRNATKKDLRDLIFDILEDDNRAYSMVTQLQIIKNWTDFPPTVLPQ